MTLTDLVAANAILPALKVNSKKQAIQELAARAAALTGQNDRTILEILLQREKLGSTAVGNGVALGLVADLTPGPQRLRLAAEPPRWQEPESDFIAGRTSGQLGRR